MPKIDWPAIVRAAERETWGKAAQMANAKAGAESDEHTAKELRALAGDYRGLAEGRET